MAQYLVISAPDIPPLGSSQRVAVYRGEHTTEDEAVEAAALHFGRETGGLLWGLTVASLTRYVATHTHTITAAPG